MANNAIINKYPVDLTGVNPNNLISREEHMLVNHEGTSYRVLVPQYGGFYTQGLDVRNASYVSLTRGVDYIATYLYEDASNQTGREICGAIVILNPLVSELVYFTAQTVGSDYAYAVGALEETVSYLAAHPGVPTWAGIIGQPTEFPPGAFDRELWQQAGFQPFNMELEKLNRAITIGDIETVYDLRDHVIELDAEFRTMLDASKATLAAHVAREDNPHVLTKEQMGLEQLQNYGMATLAEGTQATTNVKYLTPQAGKAVLDAKAIAPLNAHVNQVVPVGQMPHGETRAQLNLYTKSESDAGFANLLNKTGPGSTAVDSWNFMGSSYLSYVDNTRQFYAPNFTSGQVPTAQLGLGAHDGNYILADGGVWTSIQQIFNSYLIVNPSTYFIGYMGNDTNAFAHIEVTFANINAYPLGTVILWVSEISGIASRGNDAVAYSFKLMRVATRTAAGWRQLTPNPVFAYY